MAEKIYTIPVNEAFDKKDGCPFCALYDMLVKREFEILMGGAMMEPDVRIATNEKGFCDEHFTMLLGLQKRLQAGLMLESHLSQKVISSISKGAFSKPDKIGARIMELSDSCYICDKVEDKLSKMFETAEYLYETDSAFKNKLKEQPYFCMRHYGRFIKIAYSELPKKKFAEFYDIISERQNNYVNELLGDVSWYCKKFDYRYKDEDWKNSKDSLERAKQFLCGAEHKK